MEFENRKQKVDIFSQVYTLLSALCNITIIKTELTQKAYLFCYLFNCEVVEKGVYVFRVTRKKKTKNPFLRRMTKSTTVIKHLGNWVRGVALRNQMETVQKKETVQRRNSGCKANKQQQQQQQ